MTLFDLYFTLTSILYVGGKMRLLGLLNQGIRKVGRIIYNCFKSLSVAERIQLLVILKKLTDIIISLLNS